MLYVALTQYGSASVHRPYLKLEVDVVVPPAADPRADEAGEGLRVGQLDVDDVIQHAEDQLLRLPVDEQMSLVTGLRTQGYHASRTASKGPFTRTQKSTSICGTQVISPEITQLRRT